MRTLSRYFLGSYLALFAAVLGTGMVAIVVVEMMLNFDDILDHHKGLGGAAAYLLMRVPSYYLRDLLPIASFAAAFLALGLPARAHEITAIKSGGISPHRIVIPILLAASALSLAAFALNETLVLETARRFGRIHQRGDEISFRQGSFWYHRGNAIYNVRNADAASRTLSGVSVFELDTRGRLQRSIRADRVEIGSDSRWHFHDATRRTFDPARPEAPPRTEQLAEWSRDVAAEEDLSRLEASTRNLSLRDLRDYIDEQRREGREAASYATLFHARLSQPWTVLVFALLAAPFGLAVEHSRSLAGAALLGLGVLGAYYTARTAGSLIGAGGATAAAASGWIVFGAFAGFGLWHLTRVRR